MSLLTYKKFNTFGCYRGGCIRCADYDALSKTYQWNTGIVDFFHPKFTGHDSFFDPESFPTRYNRFEKELSAYHAERQSKREKVDLIIESLGPSEVISEEEKKNLVFVTLVEPTMTFKIEKKATAENFKEGLASGLELDVNDFWLSVDGKPLQGLMGDYQDPIVRINFRGLGGGNRRKKGSKGRKGKPRVNRRMDRTGGKALGQPARKTVIMEYFANYPLNNAGVETVALPLILNAPYSPDPANVALTTPTFQFNANGYTLYRCDKSWVTWEVLNRESFGIQAMMMIRDTALGAITGGGSLANIQEYASQGYSRVGFCAGAFGTPKLILRAQSTVDRIVGEKTAQDNLYRSLTNSIPTNITWVIIGAQSDFNMVGGLSTYIRIKMRVHFFGFIGIAVTQEEMGMCAGCRYQNTLLGRGVISPCCAVVRDCNNCGARIPCCRGPDITPNKGCLTLKVEEDESQCKKIRPVQAVYVPSKTLSRSKSLGVLRAPEAVTKVFRDIPSKVAGDLAVVPQIVAGNTSAKVANESSVLLGVDLQGREIYTKTKKL
jgi:hypothetical protein